MFDCKIEIMETFYEIYSATMISGVMNPKELKLVQQMGREFEIVPEHRDMIRRIFHAIKIGRIRVSNAEPIVMPCVAA